jgi:hypothetical protein
VYVGAVADGSRRFRSVPFRSVPFLFTGVALACATLAESLPPDR